MRFGDMGVQTLKKVGMLIPETLLADKKIIHVALSKCQPTHKISTSLA